MTIKVIMKIAIVLKLMKIVVQSHTDKTYIWSNSDNAKSLKLNFLSPEIAGPSEVQRNKSTKNRDLKTLSSILRPKGALVFRVLLH